jgi:hypothetical protein
MLYMGIVVVFSETHSTQINTMCCQRVELLNVKLNLPIVTKGFKGEISVTKPIC